jgi:hypothetical protein
MYVPLWSSLTHHPHYVDILTPEICIFTDENLLDEKSLSLVDFKKNE